MEQDQVETKEMDLEGSFNLLVNLARNSRLSYQEHSLVDNAIKMVHNALNEAEGRKNEQEE